MFNGVNHGDTDGGTRICPDSGFVLAPENVAIPKVEQRTKDAAGKESTRMIDNPVTDLVPLTVRQVDALYGKAHPGETRGANANATVSKYDQDLDAALDRVISFLGHIACKTVLDVDQAQYVKLNKLEGLIDTFMTARGCFDTEGEYVGKVSPDTKLEDTSLQDHELPTPAKIKAA
jgi:hypothetical protein